MGITLATGVRMAEPDGRNPSVQLPASFQRPDRLEPATTDAEEKTMQHGGEVAVAENDLQALYDRELRVRGEL